MSFSGWPVTINSPRQESSVVKWVLNDLVSRAMGLVASSGEADEIYEIGTVFGQQTIGALTDTVTEGDHGNGVVDTLVAEANARVGNYTLTCTKAGPGATFEVTDPTGRRLADLTSAVAYAGTDFGCTVTDGGVAWAVGDTIVIAVAAGNGKYYPVNPAAVDGTQNAAAINYARTFVPESEDTNAGMVIRDAVVVADTLIWPNGATGNQITNWLNQLQSLRIFNLPQT